MATIKVIQNGPYLVQGDDVTAVDWNGAAYPIPKRPFALCRCRRFHYQAVLRRHPLSNWLQSGGSSNPG